MRKRASVAIAIIVALVGLMVAAQAAFVSAKDRQILAFDTMVGVPQAFTSNAQPQLNIRGIIGGGLPWVIGRGTGGLSADGDLNVKVRGLVLAGTLANPVATFAATVSCLAADGTTVNVRTAAVPATLGLASAGGGNATIKADLMLPHPCIAPIVFVTNSGGSWFASTGG
jgi:hypothetical protein